MKWYKERKRQEEPEEEKENGKGGGGKGRVTGGHRSQVAGLNSRHNEPYGDLEGRPLVSPKGH